LTDRAVLTTNENTDRAISLAYRWWTSIAEFTDRPVSQSASGRPAAAGGTR
jgi:hypothetical protein